MRMRNGKSASAEILLGLLLTCPFTCNAQSQDPPISKPTPAQPSTTPPPNQPSLPATLTDQIEKTIAFITVPYGDSAKPNTTSGTCFFVAVQDERLGKAGIFVYLVTNRHVATGEGAPTNRLLPYVYVRLNVAQKQGEDRSIFNTVPLGGKFHWYLPDDPTVDLAVLPVVPGTDADIKAIPESLFGTEELLKSRGFGIGDPVFFVGYFFQFAGVSRIEPIYRSGTIAMMPTDPIPMRDNAGGEGTPEHLYLADAHAFHGNSGSPLFVNLGGYRNGTMLLGMPNIYLVGIVNGFIPEVTNGRATGAATFEGDEGQLANSGILTFVPAQELRDLLYSSQLQGLRDSDAAAMPKR